jgi:hypothetical protein
MFAASGALGIPTPPPELSSVTRLVATFPWWSSVVFWQSWHLQRSWQGTPAWKHSQYFFKQADFLQWHPDWCKPKEDDDAAAVIDEDEDLGEKVSWADLLFSKIAILGLSTLNQKSLARGIRGRNGEQTWKLLGSDL